MRAEEVMCGWSTTIQGLGWTRRCTKRIDDGLVVQLVLELSLRLRWGGSASAVDLGRRGGSVTAKLRVG